MAVYYIQVKGVHWASFTSWPLLRKNSSKYSTVRCSASSITRFFNAMDSLKRARASSFVFISICIQSSCQKTVREICFPKPANIRKRVESWISVRPFSIFDIYDFLVPILSANCSWVRPASFLCCFNVSARQNASAAVSNRSLSSVPLGPYSTSRMSSRLLQFTYFSLSLLLIFLPPCF